MLTQTHVLAVADALHAHTADNLVLTVPTSVTSGEICDGVRRLLIAALRESDPHITAASARRTPIAEAESVTFSTGKATSCGSN